MSTTPNFLSKCLVASRPFAYPASLTAVGIGGALACLSGASFRWGLFLLTLAGVILFHTAANLLNDVFDHRRGLDTQVLPTSGAIVRGWFSERQVFLAAMVLLGLGCAVGFYLAWIAGWPVLVLGAVGTLIALRYTANGFCFKYSGLGDIAIAVAFGALPVFGTYWVQTQAFSWVPLIWSVPGVCLTVAILHANNWHDIDRDHHRGCRTVASMLGWRGSAVYYRGLVIGPFTAVVLLVVAAPLLRIEELAPLPALAVLAALPATVKLLRISTGPTPESIAGLDAQTARVQMLFGILAAAGLAAGRIV